MLSFNLFIVLLIEAVNNCVIILFISFYTNALFLFI